MMRLARTPLLGCVVLVGATFLSRDVAHAQGAKANPAVQKLFDKIMDAIQKKDRDAFVAEATEEVKKGTTQEVMDAFEKALGTRLKKGFERTYLCQLKQAGHDVHLWKVTFKDGGDDLVVRIALKDGKIGGFFLQ